MFATWKPFIFWSEGKNWFVQDCLGKKCIYQSRAGLWELLFDLIAVNLVAFELIEPCEIMWEWPKRRTLPFLASAVSPCIDLAICTEKPRFLIRDQLVFASGCLGFLAIISHLQVCSTVVLPCVPLACSWPPALQSYSWYATLTDRGNKEYGESGATQPPYSCLSHVFLFKQ